MKNIKCLIIKVADEYAQGNNRFYDTILCWKEGQINFTGQCLLDNYSDDEKVKDLFKNGDIYKIGDSINNCIFFGRDFEFAASECGAKKLRTSEFNKFIFDHQEIDYVYYYRFGNWSVLKNDPVSNDGFDPLLDIITPTKKRKWSK